MKKKRQAKTEEHTKLQRENDRLAKKRKCQAKTEEQTANCHAKIEEHKDDMANVINQSIGSNENHTQDNRSYKSSQT
jgi:hypothetical protein